MNATNLYVFHLKFFNFVVFGVHMQISEDMVQNVVDILVKVVISEGSTLASVAMESLGHIGLRCALPSINQNSSTG